MREARGRWRRSVPRPAQRGAGRDHRQLRRHGRHLGQDAAAVVHAVGRRSGEAGVREGIGDDRASRGRRELGIGITAYGALSRGLLTGSAPTAKGDLRANLPRFSAENREKNRELVERLRALAAEKRCTPAQLAIAWSVSRGEDVVPVIGARTVAQLEEALGALDVELSAEEADRLAEAITPAEVAGTRYDERQMKSLDSEK